LVIKGCFPPSLLPSSSSLRRCCCSCCRLFFCGMHVCIHPYIPFCFWRDVSSAVDIVSVLKRTRLRIAYVAILCPESHVHVSFLSYRERENERGGPSTQTIVGCVVLDVGVIPWSHVPSSTNSPNLPRYCAIPPPLTPQSVPCSNSKSR